MSVVSEMNLNMEEGEILYLGKHKEGGENEGSPNISRDSVKGMHFIANRAL